MSDMIEHPAHYNTHEYECIDEMIAMFGVEAVISFCKCNAWKYRYRADSKGSHDEDMKKSDWYVNKAIQLRRNMDANTETYSGVQMICRGEWVIKNENHQPETRHIAES